MHWQFLRYTVVGITSNLVLYVIYLLATSFGVGHKTAMTLLYGVGILQTFLLNRRWTFNHQGYVPSALTRYIAIYALGYLVNFAGLYLFVDELGFPHQVIQGLLILIVAVLLFMLQRIWVFNNTQTDEPGYGA